MRADRPIIASLSSIPTRFKHLSPVLEAVLRQTIGFDEVRLYLPRRYRRFPDYDGSLPDVPKGVRIIQVDEDLGPASKVLFAARDLTSEDCDIFYCDDDHIYARDWVSRMIRQRKGRLDHCVATINDVVRHDNGIIPPPRQPLAVKRQKARAYDLELRARRMLARLSGRRRVKPFFKRIAKGGYGSVACGVGGVLVRPDFFDDQFYDIPPVLWAVDDFWLSGHFERKGIPIWVASHFRWPGELPAGRVDALYHTVIDGVDRAEANAACVRYMQDTYGIWLP